MRGSPRPVRVGARRRRGRGGRCVVAGEARSSRRCCALAWLRRASTARASAARKASRSSAVAAATSASAASAVATAAVASARRAAAAAAAASAACEGSLGVGEDGREPVRHLAPPDRRSDAVAWRRLGEGAALGDGGDVGAVGGEDGFEDVAGFGEVVAVGDDADHVVVAAAGGGDVQAAAGGGRRGEGDGGVDGVGLVAVLGGGVAEPDVVADVVGGEGDGAVSAWWVTVIAPSASMAVTVQVSRLRTGSPLAGDEVAVVAAGGDDVADMGASRRRRSVSRGRGRGGRRRGGRSGWRG